MIVLETSAEKKGVRPLKRTHAAMEGLSVNKTAHDGHAAAAAGGVSAPMTLEPAFTRGLQTAAVDEFRRNYQRFREGKARGARGERPTAAPRVRTCELPFRTYMGAGHSA